MRSRFVVLLLLGLAGLPHVASGQETTQAPVEGTAPVAEAPSSSVDAKAPAEAKPVLRKFTQALLVAGITKDPEQQQAEDRAITQLVQFLTEQQGLARENIRVLVDSASVVSGASGRSTLDTLEKELGAMAKRLTADDVFLFYYVGEANTVNSVMRMNLPGPDITHTEFAAAFNLLKPGRAVVVFDCPAAGHLIAPLAHPDRIVIATARLDQPYRTQFSEFFVPAWTDPNADANGDGFIAITEAFKYAEEKIDALYRDQDLMKTENALLEDTGDGKASQFPWRYAAGQGDGAKAAEFALAVPATSRGNNANE